MQYNVEIVERKNLILQLEASKLSIKDLFDCLLNKLKGFKNYCKSLVKKIQA